MSHLTHVKTCFQNLFYLEKTLTKLNISHQVFNLTKVIIPQSSNSNVEFTWNGQEYELVADRDFWKQSSSMDHFVEQIAQKYAALVIIGETQKLGFQPVQQQQNSDGSNTIVLERWKTNLLT